SKSLVVASALAIVAAGVWWALSTASPGEPAIAAQEQRDAHTEPAGRDRAASSERVTAPSAEPRVTAAISGEETPPVPSNIAPTISRSDLLTQIEATLHGQIDPGAFLDLA